ncbi:MAG: mechanosensitive ion channel [Saprospiraceae bacterium]
MTIRELLKYTILDIGSYKLTVGAVLVAILVYFLARLLLRLSARMMERIGKKRGLDAGRQMALQQLMSYIIWVLSIFLILEVIGIKPTLLLASSAALLVGLGFGLQQIFADVISGVFLLFEGTIHVGDILEVDGMIGRIEQISLRTSMFKTRDDINMIIPNRMFINDRVVNWSHDNKATRFKVSVGVSYSSDVQKVRSILMQCALDNEDVLTDDASRYPLVRFVAFGESSLDFELFFYSKNMFRIENTLSDLRFAIRKEFLNQHVEIPFPQRDLHLRTANPEIHFSK